MPVLALPGSHDIPLFDLWTRLRSPYGRYSVEFGADLEPVHRSAELLLVCVNATRPWRPWRHKDGEVSALQIDCVARLMEHAELAQLRVVVVHQPIAGTRAEDESNRLCGHTVALRRWVEAGADLVIGGHIHLPYVMALQDLARPLWAVQAGTAVSSRLRKRCAELGEPSALGRGCDARMLSDRAVGPQGRRRGFPARQGQRGTADQGLRSASRRVHQLPKSRVSLSWSSGSVASSEA